MNLLASIGHNNPPTEMEMLQERLSSYSQQKDTLERLASKVIPETVEDEQESGALTDHVKALKNLASDIEKIFKKEKAPFWDCCKAADEWKNDYLKKIDTLVATASGPILAFNKKKEAAERQRQLDLARKAKEDAEKLAREAEAHEEEGIHDTAAELMSRAVQEDQKADMIQHNAFHGVVGRSRGGFSVASNRKTWTGYVDSRAALDLEALRRYFSEDDLNKAIRAAVKDGVRNLQGAKIYEEEKLSVR